MTGDKVVGLLDRVWRWFLRALGAFVFYRSATGTDPDLGAMAIGAGIALLPNSEKAVEAISRVLLRDSSRSSERE